MVVRGRGPAGRALVPAAAVVALAVVLGAAGCKDPTAVPRQSQLEGRDLTVVVGPDGSVQVEEVVTFASDAGGLVGVASTRPFATLGGITVDGQPPAEGQAARMTFGGTELRIAARSATLAYAVTGAVETWADLTVLQLDLHGPASDASRQDPEVDLRATITLPEGAAAGEVLPHWANGLHREQRTEGAVVTLDGTVPAWTGSSVAIGFAAGTVALPEGVGPTLVHGTPHRDDFEAQQAAVDANTDSLEATLDSQADAAALVRPIFLGVAGLVLLLMVVSARRGQRDERRRRARLTDDVPSELRQPPGDDSPAVVALLLAKGERVARGGVAGAVLRLVERRAASIEGITSEQFVFRLAPSPPAVGAADALLLGALAGELDADGVRRGPPLWSRSPRRFWTAYRRAVLREARAAGFLDRVHKPLAFGSYAFMFAFCTWPLWLDRSLVGILPFVGVAGMIVAFPFVVALSVTDAGARRRAEWLAFRRFLVEEGQLEHVGAPGVAVWGEHLVYGAALGVAPLATDALAPPAADARVRARADSA